MQQNFCPRRFKESIAGKPSVTLEELLQRAEKYIRIEETTGLKTPDERRPPPPNTYTQFAPLNARLSKVLIVAERHSLIQPPRPLRESSKRAKSDKYYHFHRDRGYTTEDYFHLKQEIKRLICKGYLTEFIDTTNNKKSRSMLTSDDQGYQGRGGGENLPTTGVIAFIFGGPANRDLSNARRALLCTVSEVNSYTLSKELTFRESDLEGRREQYNDFLVISATLSNFWVKKILVDSGNSADIIFNDTFLKLNIDNVYVSLVITPLTGFKCEVVEVLGEVALPFSLGSYPRRITKMVKFLVVNTPSTYNMIFGRLSLNLFRAITSTYHMKLKFSTSEGIECYANTLQKISANLKQQGGGDDLPKMGKRKLVHSHEE
ncbi:hypothetical protein Pfo_013837 [Paulownia fortunei]|nr:hypothetical protein Pfo_013837 [Paulownia fortunei]